MGAPVFIGDELTAVGYRLAGAVTHVADAAEDPAALLEQAYPDTPLLLLGEGFAARLPEPVLAAAQRRLSPLVLVVPEAGGGAPVQDLSGWFQAQLGIE